MTLVVAEPFRHIKSLGQHFLNDPSVATRIVDAFKESLETQSILEVGPGDGALTDILYDLPNKELVLSETDQRLFEPLRKRYPNANLVEGDFLQCAWEQIFTGSFSVIGNFPYNISSQILFCLLKMRDSVPLLVGMFQKEVAERVCADEGSRTYGILSVILRTYYKRELLFEVASEKFDPPPKVDSAVIRLTRRTDTPEVDHRNLLKVVKQGFAMRRKKLSNALKPITKGRIAIPYAEKRAEELNEYQFIEIVNSIYNEDPGYRRHAPGSG